MQLIHRTVAALAVASVFSPAAFAQSEPVTELPRVEVRDEYAPFTSSNVQTGVFRDTPPLEVPLTVNTVTREVMDAQAATTLHDALKNTAGVTRAQLGEGTYDNIAIRGLLVENRTSYRLNGALPVVNLIDMPLDNKERVEVLKGASALHYGFVPPSGIVNLVTKRAGAAPVTTIEARGNEYGAFGVHGDLGRQFGEHKQFGVRLNVSAGDERNAIDDYKGNKQFYSAALDWRVTDRWQLKFDGEYIEKDVVEQASIRLPAAVGGRITLPRIPDAENLLSGTWARYDAEAGNALLRSDFSLSDDWMWTVEAGRAITKRDRVFTDIRNYDLATGAGQLVTFPSIGQEFENQFLRNELFGTFTTGPLRHELTLGYSHNRLDQDLGRRGSATVAQNLFDPRDVDESEVAATLTQGATAKVYDRGLYAFDRVHIGEKWQVMAGIRNTRYKREPSAGADYEVTKNGSMYALLYKLTARTNLYGSYLEGLEETGVAGPATANAGETLNPAVSRQREVGVKTEVGNGLQLTAAYFDIDRAAAGTVNNVFGITGKFNYQGLEFSAAGPIAKGWRMYATALYLDAEQVSSRNDPTLIGNEPDQTPSHTVSLFFEHDLAAVPGLSISAGGYLIGERPVNTANQAYAPSYTRYDLGVRYRTKIAGEKVTLQAYLENVTDKEYWAAAGDSYLAVGQPRTLKLQARVDL